MANLKKSWFLSPTWDIPPPAIQLGQLLTDATEPRYPINPSAITTSESSAPEDTPPPIDTQIFTAKNSHFSLEVSADTSTRLGLWGQFLQAIGLSAEAKLTLSKGAVSTYAFDEVQTQWFNPSAAYVRALVGTKPVRDFLEAAGTKKPLYMVTGIKVVLGAELATRDASGRNYGAKFGVDGTSAGAPMAAGPKFERDVNRGMAVSWRSEGPMIFAYQVVKVELRKGKAKTSAYTNGAMFKAGGREEETPLEVTISDELMEADFGHGKGGKMKKMKTRTFEAVESFEEESRDECRVIVPSTA